MTDSRSHAADGRALTHVGAPRSLRRAELQQRHRRAQGAYQDALERQRAANEYVRIREEALQKTWDALQKVDPDAQEPLP